MIPFPKIDQAGQEIIIAPCIYCSSMVEHLCPKGEQMRNQFMLMLKMHGAEVLEGRARRTEWYKRFYRRWPFDGMVHPADIEKVQDYLASGAPSPEEVMVMEQASAEYLSRLTPKEKGVAEKLAQGYKPRDIAKMEGKPNSGSVRWLKHSIKLKFTKETR